MCAHVNPLLASDTVERARTPVALLATRSRLHPTTQPHLQAGAVEEYGAVLHDHVKQVQPVHVREVLHNLVGLAVV
jgi:hypothetical protein